MYQVVLENFGETNEHIIHSDDIDDVVKFIKNAKFTRLVKIMNLSEVAKPSNKKTNVEFFKMKPFIK